MVNFILLLICLLLGLLFQRFEEFPKNAHLALNGFIIYVCLPALSLLHIPRIPLSAELLFPIGVAWIVFLLAVIIFILLKKWLQLSRATTGALILTAGLGNTSFIGFPVIEALFGAEGLKIALMVDQPGSFVVVSTLGILTASIFAEGETSLKRIVRKILFFPPFIAFLLALALRTFDYEHHANAAMVLEKLGSPITPLALVSVGMQLKWKFEQIRFRELFAGLFYKLLLAPAAIYLLYVGLLKGKGMMIQVSVMEAAMAPMITGAIVATNNNLNPRLANMMTGLGIPLSFLTLVMWYFIMSE
jgi:malate permease and related proteins